MNNVNNKPSSSLCASSASRASGASGRMKKCPKCGKRKTLPEFGNNKDSEDGHTAYCKVCRNAMGRKRRELNVSARLKHHIGTRVVAQLGPMCPSNLVRNLEGYLGYPITRLVYHLQEELCQREPDRSLRDALQEGYHVDHIKPLSSFVVAPKGTSHVDWEQFRLCWAPENLRAITAEANLEKGSRLE